MNADVGSTDRAIAISGLPGSGKTSYLAALWHLVTARDVSTLLRFDSLRGGSVAHLNAIAARWRSARVQDRTPLGSSRIVSMNLLDAEGRALRVTFPDISGEIYRRMWEDRDCSPEAAQVLQSRGVLLFVHADTIQAPQWVVDFVELSRRLGLPPIESDTVPWHPRLAPTQVQLVGLLQLLRVPPLDHGPRRLGLVLSAWDKAEGERLSPTAFVELKLPLLHQYLRRSFHQWTWRAFGVSAQGGDYDAADEGAFPTPQADALRALDRPSVRIRVVDGDRESHDLTSPLAWLME